jgi:hypothetical protein
MRGETQEQDRMFGYRPPADRVPMDPPLRGVKDMANRALKELSPEFDKMYAPMGRPTIANGRNGYPSPATGSA